MVDISSNRLLCENAHYKRDRRDGYGEAAEGGVGALEDARSTAASVELALGTFWPR